MQELHLRFTKYAELKTDRSETQGVNVSVNSVETYSIDPLSSSRVTHTEPHADTSDGLSPRQKPSFLSRYNSKASIPESQDESRFSPSQPLSRKRPFSAYTPRTAKKSMEQGKLRSWRQPDPPLSPYAVVIKGAKVHECLQRGVMFRPAPHNLVSS